MAKVLISGGTGSIGSLMADFLHRQGHEVGLLSRSEKNDGTFKTYKWNIKDNYLDPEALESCDYIIHLAGAGIADKAWTAGRKKEIIESRVLSTDLLYNQVKKHKTPLKAFISASAVGYYGQVTSNKNFTEKDKSANDFVGKTCFLWEQAAEQFEDLGIRTVRLRIGVVLMEKGGALEKMVQPIRMGFGSPLGSGKQYIPWIHVDDLIGMFYKALTSDDMSGAYNAVAPEPASNAEFTRILARVLNKKLWLPNVPAFVLKALLGDRASLVLKGSRVSSQKIESTGFTFKYTSLEPALKNLLSG
jgi:uncharacterized protein (TIGR01777 family)